MSLSIYADLRGKNAPLLLTERARAEPERVAFRAKHRGLYRERTWRDYAERVARCASSLSALGLARGERVSIMGDACEEWLMCDLAAQACGAITYGIYPTASSAEVEYQMQDGGASIFVAEDQEYVDKILPLVDRLPDLRWIVVIDTTAMFGYDHPKLRSYRELMDAAGESSLDSLERRARAIQPSDPAFIVYTSGTTGPPKGALVAHGKHLAAAYTLVDHYPALAEEQSTVVYLPLCHVLGRDVAITLPLISGIVPHFGESIEALPQTLFEVAPTVLFAVPRYLQKFASQVLVGIANTSALKRLSYDSAMRVGRGTVRSRWESGAKRGALGPLYRALHAIALRPVLNKIGFDCLRLVICGGAPLPPETMALWQIWGVNLLEIYGQTETAGGIITGQRESFARPGDVGTVPHGWKVRLDEANEILVKGEDIFEGYWNNPQATREVIDAEGWLHTGDVGQWCEGHDGRLKLVDRARDFIVTSGGKTLSPSYIENIVRASPYIGEIIVFGHGRKYITALVEIDYDTVADWARARNVSYTGFTSLTQHAEVERLIRSEIDKANAQIARVEQIKAFRILPKALDPEEEGEPVTPTRKVKRKLMYERFRDEVESMYSDDEERLLVEGVGNVLQPAA